MALLPWRVHVLHSGKTVTRRTRNMLRAAQKIVGFPILLGQGSYNPGGVKASGGTHDREAVDIRTYTLDKQGRLRRLTPEERIRVVHALKDVGFAAWHRASVPNLWDEHIHALPIGGDLSRGAAWQVVAYDAGRDGLTGNRPDLSYRPKPRVKWSYTLGRPVAR